MGPGLGDAVVLSDGGCGNASKVKATRLGVEFSRAEETLPIPSIEGHGLMRVEREPVGTLFLFISNGTRKA